MGKHLCLILWAVASLAHLAECDRTASRMGQSSASGASSSATPRPRSSPQAEPRAVEGDSAQGRTIGGEENATYGLSVSVYTDTLLDMYLYDVTVRYEKTGQTSLSRHIYSRRIFPADAPNLWSPDGEYLALPCAGDPAGFCFYKASGIVEVFKKKFGSKSVEDNCEQCFAFQIDNEPADSIVIVTDKGEREFSHEFVGWGGNTSLVFKVYRPKTQGDENATEYGYAGEYEYDIAGRKLYCRDGDCAVGENKKGKVRAARRK